MSELRRQRPIVVLIIIVERIKVLLTYIIGIAVARNVFSEAGPSSKEFGFTLTILLILLGLALCASCLRWLTLRYAQTEDGTLHIESGLLVKKKTTLSKNRVQTIEMSSTLMQRLLGYVELKVQTAAGEKNAEFALPVLPLAEAKTLRQRLLEITEEPLALGASGKELKEPQTTQFNFSTWHIVRSGALRFPLRVMLLTYLAIDQLIPDKVVANLFGSLLEAYQHSSTIYSLGIMLLVLIIAWIGSIIYELIRYWGFSLTLSAPTQTGDAQVPRRVHIQYGLTGKRFHEFETSRIQFVTLTQNPIQGLFGVADLYVKIATAGVGQLGDTTVLVAPSISLIMIEQLLSSLRSVERLPQALISLPKRAQATYILGTTVRYCLYLLPIFWFLQMIGWVVSFKGLLLLFSFMLIGRIKWKNGAHETAKEHFILRSGFWNIETHVFPLKKIVACKISQNPIQLKRRLCKFAILSAGSRLAISLSGVDRQQADFAVDWFSSKSKPKWLQSAGSQVVH